MALSPVPSDLELHVAQAFVKAWKNGGILLSPNLGQTATFGPNDQAIWYADQLQLIDSTLLPAWFDLFAKANPGVSGIMPPAQLFAVWVQSRITELAELLANSKERAIQAAFDAAAAYNWSPIQLQSFVKATSHLTPQQVSQAAKLQQTAPTAVKAFASKAAQNRALRIASHELFIGYNQAAQTWVDAHVENGSLPPMQRIWSTARDERVCPGICKPRDGLDIDQNGWDPPPSHMQCRCGIKYVMGHLAKSAAILPRFLLAEDVISKAAAISLNLPRVWEDDPDESEDIKRKKRRGEAMGQVGNVDHWVNSPMGDSATGYVGAVGKAEPHEFQSTQFNLPDSLAILIALHQTTIDPGDLAEGGLKAQPHITALYGLHPDVDACDVARALEHIGPPTVRFTDLATFPEGESGVPLILSIDSPDLQRIHTLLEALPHTSTFPEYRPHVTIAYLTPDAARTKCYTSATAPLHGTATLDEITFCHRDEQQVGIPLDTGIAKNDQPLGWSTDVVARIRKFNPFHDSRGEFSSQDGSPNPTSLDHHKHHQQPLFDGGGSSSGKGHSPQGGSGQPNQNQKNPNPNQPKSSQVGQNQPNQPSQPGQPAKPAKPTKTLIAHLRDAGVPSSSAQWKQLFARTPGAADSLAATLNHSVHAWQIEQARNQAYKTTQHDLRERKITDPVTVYPAESLDNELVTASFNPHDNATQGYSVRRFQILADTDLLATKPGFSPHLILRSDDILGKHEVGFNADIDEPPIPPLEKWEHLAGGCVVVDGSDIYLVQPKGNFGGYQHTFPKGTVEPGEHIQDTALRELREETGLEAHITGYLGDYLGDTSTSRMYIATRTGGSPNAGDQKETASVPRVSILKAFELCNKERDKEIVADTAAWLQHHWQQLHKSGQVGNPNHDASGKFSSQNTSRGAATPPTSPESENVDTRLYGDAPYNPLPFASEIKYRVHRALADRLADNPAFAAYVARHATDPVELVEGELIPQDTTEHVVHTLVSLWAGMSGDSEPKAIAIQLAAQQEFGLDDAATAHFGGWAGDSISEAARPYVMSRAHADLDANGPAYQAFVRAVYDNTQADLAKKGITSLTLYRGLMYDSSTDTRAAGFECDGAVHTTAVTSQPLNSWSSDPTMAAAFTARDGAILAAVIPAARIYSTPATGVGCRTESEIVVLGGRDLVNAWSGAGKAFTPDDVPRLFQPVPISKSGQVDIAIDTHVHNADWLKSRSWDIANLDGTPVETVRQLRAALPFGTNLRHLLQLPCAAAMPEQLRSALA